MNEPIDLKQQTEQNPILPEESSTSGEYPSQETELARIRESAAQVKSTPAKALPIRTVSCPRCDKPFQRNCGGLEESVICPSCKQTFPYVDGFLNYYKNYIEVFIDRVHPLPLVPGYSTGGTVELIPDELIVADFGIQYRRPPEVFFILPGGKAAREWIQDNQILIPLSVGTSNVIFFSRPVARGIRVHPVSMQWMAIGELEDWGKPLWLNYLQNAAELVRKEEDVAAVVMLLIALDFLYDFMLDRLGITYEVVRRVGRRPGMNEKKAKLHLLDEMLGGWPGTFAGPLRDLTDYRNSIVHGVVKREDIPIFSSRRAFQIVMRATLFLIELYHRRPAQQTQG